jgi:hypothetical protein
LNSKTSPTSSRTDSFRFLRLILFLAFAGSVGAQSSLSWTNNLLTFRDPRIPGGSLDIFYLEAFCRPGGHERNWSLTRVPHQTRLIATAADTSELRFHTTIDPDFSVLHEVRTRTNGLEMTFLLSNHGTNVLDLQWFQPACIRVDRFTGRDQSGYTARSFVFTSAGLTPLDRTRRTTEALYTGGQVYLPPWIQPIDANPRPVSLDRITNGIIGCISADDRQILAVASDRTFELFEGVYVCLHSDPWIGGLQHGESRRIRQILYLIPNDPALLLRCYQEDFPHTGNRW